MTTVLTGELWRKMIFNAAAMLENNKDQLNALNVFPVPDGDTGTNMSMTFAGAAQETAVDASGPDTTIVRILEAMSAGGLKGARGNSGVILSQIISGFASHLRRRKKGEEPYTALFFAQALERGREKAYEAVMRPKEGTILTVITDIAKAAQKYVAKYDDFEGLMKYIVDAGDKSVRKTRHLLPQLAEAGVVDAGGAGLLMIMTAFRMAIEGKELDASALTETIAPVDFTDIAACDREIEFGYCTEFFVKHLFPEVGHTDVSKLRHKLGEIGDCVLVVGDTKLVKVHVHTNTPGTALNYGGELGELSRIKIDNMREQHRELPDGAAQVPSAPRDMAVVAVVSGDGFRTVFTDCQITDFVEGGQSMNPSAQDISRAIRSANAKTVLILPNNKNIILAAEQAQRLVDCAVHVLPTKTLPEGVAAAIAYDPEASAEENEQRMREAVKSVWTGLVTRAVRSTTMKGLQIKEGEFIGIAGSDVVTTGPEILPVITDLVKKAPEGEIVTIYYGADESEADAKKVQAAVAKVCPDCDVELLLGGQPVYSYVISSE